MTGGDLKIEVLPAGAVVPAFQCSTPSPTACSMAARRAGLLVWQAPGRLAVRGRPRLRTDADQLLAWYYYGGGEALLSRAARRNPQLKVVSFPYGPMPTQPLGWYKKPINKAGRLQGHEVPHRRISIDVFTGMGAAVNALPGGEIVAAMDRGLIEAAEFNNATSDRVLGFADVSKICMLQSYHQNAEQMEISFNKTKFDALPARSAASDCQWRRGCITGYAVEGDRPLLEGLHRVADQG